MTLVFARLIARCLSGALVTIGYLDPAIGAQIGADQDVIMVLGFGLGLFAELAYAVAKKLGWRT